MSNSPKHTVELFLDCKAQIGEAPFYDVVTNQLIWVDIWGCTVNFLDVDSKVNRSLKLPDSVSAAIPVEGSENLSAALLGRRICLVDKTSGSVMELAEVEKDKPSNRFNDGKCDSSGRLWCGTLERLQKFEAGSKPAMPTPNVGALYSYSAGQIAKHLGDLTVANGMAWSPDSRNMYFIETFKRKVSVFDFDITTGTLSNQRVAVDYAKDETLGYPDGMCTDAQGRLWVCGFYGPGVTCFDPETGKQLAQIPIPAGNATSCCFGGPDFNWLFVTSASFATSEEEWKTYPHSGGLFVVKDLSAKGAPAYRFKQ